MKGRLIQLDLAVLATMLEALDRAHATEVDLQAARLMLTTTLKTTLCRDKANGASASVYDLAAKVYAQ